MIYKATYQVSQAISWVAMRFDIPWLFELGGRLELWADERG